MTEASEAASVRRALPAMSSGASFVFLVWGINLFEPQWFIGGFVGGGPLLQRISLLLLIPTLLVAVQSGGPRALYWPLTAFTLLHLVNVYPASNRGLAFMGLKATCQILILFAAAMSVMDAPDRAMRLMKLFLLSLLWYAAQGLVRGRVFWHPEMANPDAFGSFAAIAVGFGYFFAGSASVPRWRQLGFAASALGLMGVVRSFARGAILTAALVLFLTWLRSPRKMVTLLRGAAAAVLVFAIIQVLYPKGEFWSEIASSFSEGKSSGTGADRWSLWTIGWMVFKEHPILGAGAYNAGVVGTQIVPYGMFKGFIYDNPETLYNRPLHNTFVQILSEEGAVGMALWLFMLFDFWRRIRRMRRPAAVAAWRRSSAGSFDLFQMSLALELGMIGYLGGSVLYNCTYRLSFYTLMLLAVLLSEAATGAGARREAGGARGPVPALG